MSDKQFQSFEEFWPHYVAEHSHPRTRALHAAGTATSIVCALAFIARRKWKLLPLALLPGYGAAWLAHFFIEKNKPATFDYPLWSFVGDYKMIAMMIAGTMDAEVERGLAERRKMGEGTRVIEDH
jgi:hypothetical protein